MRPMRLPLVPLLVLTACGPSAVLSVNTDRNTARADSTDAITITATVKDPSGQPTFGALVNFDVTAPGILSGVAVSTDVMGNAVTRLTSPEAKTLTVTVNTVGAAKPVSVPFTFTPTGNTTVTPTALRFSASPSTTSVSNLLRPIPTVAIEGEGGAKTTSTAQVTVRITPGSCTATLGGTSLTTVAATDGTASFNGLVAGSAGTGCTLTADSPDLAPAVSQPFDIQ